MKKLLSGVIFLAAALSLCACSYTPGIVDISVPENEIQIELGGSQVVSVDYMTEDQQEGFSAPFLSSVAPADVTLEFSSNSDTVIVDANGKMVGVAPGEAVITVKASNRVSEKTAEIKVICFEYQQNLSELPEVMEVRLGEKLDLAELYDEYIRWNALVRSQDDDIVEVAGSTLTPLKAGDATISLTLGSERKDIILRGIETVTEYKLNHTELERAAGTMVLLGIDQYLPETANEGLTLTYSSSDEEIVTVDPNGLVRFIAPGKAVITTFNEQGIEDECQITVTEVTSNLTEAYYLLREGGILEILNSDGEQFGIAWGVDDDSTDWPLSNSVIPPLEAFFSVSPDLPGLPEYSNLPGFFEAIKRIDSSDFSDSNSSSSPSGSSSNGSSISSGSSGQVSSAASTNPADYDTSNPAVAAVLKMVDQPHKCSEIAEAAANAQGETGWVDHGSYNVLEPEGFLGIGTKVSAEQIQPGDILYYKDGGWGFSHVAVYIGNGMAVHGNFDTAGTTKIASAFYTTVTHIIHID